MPNEQLSKADLEHEASPKNRGIFDRSITDHRQLVYSANSTLQPAKDVRTEDILVQVRDNIKLPIKRYLFTKKNSDPNQQKINVNYPTLFYIPGTAFIANENRFTHVICSHLCSIAKCQVIVINHRLAPEDQFPAGYEDVYDIFKYFVKDMPEFHCIDTNRIAIAGYSSGGNFAALLALQAKQEGLPFCRQILLSPIVDLSRSLNKFKSFENKDNAISEEFVNWFFDLYIPEKEKFNLRNPKMSPFWNALDKFKGLPPTDIVLAENDRFRGDAEYYYGKLLAAGVNSYRLEEKNENHGYLWHNLSVIENIGNRLEIIFRPDNIEHMQLPKHTLLMLSAKKELENANQNKENGKEMLRAKL